MKVNLLADYRGVLTDERFYPAGVHDLPDGQANAMVDAGRAELVVEKKATVTVKKPVRRRVGKTLATKKK